MRHGAKPGPSEQDAREPLRTPHSVRIKAMLHAHGTCRRVEVINYSHHGLGLERASGIELQERVTVELPSGLRLPMMVLWVKGGRAGLRFLGPIEPGHLVMRSLDEAARKYKRRRTSSRVHKGAWWELSRRNARLPTRQAEVLTASTCAGNRALPNIARREGSQIRKHACPPRDGH